MPWQSATNLISLLSYRSFLVIFLVGNVDHPKSLDSDPLQLAARQIPSSKQALGKFSSDGSAGGFFSTLTRGELRPDSATSHYYIAPPNHSQNWLVLSVLEPRMRVLVPSFLRPIETAPLRLKSPYLAFVLPKKLIIMACSKSKSTSLASSSFSDSSQGR